MVRVLALDMDDTLLRSDGTISDPTLDLLQRWRAAGNLVVIATGRPPRSIAGSLPEMLHDVPWIAYNGAEIRHTGRTIFSDLMPVDEVRQLVAWTQSALPGWRVGIEMDDTLYINRHIAPARPHVFVDDLLTVAQRPAAKVILSPAEWRPIGQAPTDAANHDGAASRPFAPLEPLLAQLPPATRPMLSERYQLAQFMSATADKAVALRHVVETWGLTMAHVIACGDDVNDVDMLRVAGVGIAMDNAIDTVRAAADRVTLTNDEDGVAAVLQELLDHTTA